MNDVDQGRGTDLFDRALTGAVALILFVYDKGLRDATKQVEDSSERETIHRLIVLSVGHHSKWQGLNEKGDTQRQTPKAKDRQNIFDVSSYLC
jgi:hypothetical protein